MRAHQGVQRVQGGWGCIANATNTKDTMNTDSAEDAVNAAKRSTHRIQTVQRMQWTYNVRAPWIWSTVAQWWGEGSVCGIIMIVEWGGGHHGGHGASAVVVSALYARTTLYVVYTRPQ